MQITTKPGRQLMVLVSIIVMQAFNNINNIKTNKAARLADI